MLISHTHQFIFFHVPKAGGISVREALGPYAQEPERFKINRPPKRIGGAPNPVYEMWDAALLHAKARDAKKELPKHVYDGFYKFAFVRNPWDWHVSMYHFIRKEKNHIRHDRVKSMTFEKYLEWAIQTPNPFPKGASKFQKDMVTDENGKIIVDFIGKYENLESDFQHVCPILNIKAELPHLNKSAHKDYRTYYNAKTIKMVKDGFKEDIELFDYSFNSQKNPGETLDNVYFS
ncbi:Sulfotransferase [Candidatus Desulfarcum epimagneticum]|uniref:Sulfotransferase n=1 Tax=uncultured Desulfobacteraceae bacterium TaxID=218296 RepID=A0A484HD90_9BACT|nr:Sulfotransferase [uncultured Desulfobacteraceae bacterium]